MYLPRHFAESRPEVLGQLILARPFGLLVTQDGEGEISADAIPFVLDPDPAGGPGLLRAHVARANPLWQRSDPGRDVLVVFQGPQGYVSPAWYPSKAEHGKVVPTWNYIVAQGRGRLCAIEDEAWLRAFVERLTVGHESPRAAPWAVDDAPADFVKTMLGAIVGIEIVLSSLVGKWKLSQNRSLADRAGVVDGLSEAGPSTDGASQALARQVQAPGSAL